MCFGDYVLTFFRRHAEQACEMRGAALLSICVPETTLFSRSIPQIRLVVALGSWVAVLIFLVEGEHWPNER